jgi:hypothetical protein
MTHRSSAKAWDNFCKLRIKAPQQVPASTYRTKTSPHRPAPDRFRSDRIGPSAQAMTSDVDRLISGRAAMSPSILIIKAAKSGSNIQNPHQKNTRDLDDRRSNPSEQQRKAPSHRPKRRQPTHSRPRRSFLAPLVKVEANLIEFDLAMGDMLKAARTAAKSLILRHFGCETSRQSKAAPDRG